MAKGYALLVGAGKINNGFYTSHYGKSYEPFPVSGFDKDIENITRVLEASNFTNSNIRVLTGDSANTSRVIAELSKISTQLTGDDLFIFYFTGHGDLLEDKNVDEISGFDQVLVLENDYLVDDQINIAFNLFKSSVRIVMIVDACHSGTSNEIFMIDNAITTFTANIIQPNALLNNITVVPKNYQMIYMSATSDDKLAEGGSNGSRFTNQFTQLFTFFLAGNKIQTLTYRTFMDILKGFGTQYREVGKITNEFKANYPFQL